MTEDIATWKELASVDGMEVRAASDVIVVRDAKTSQRLDLAKYLGAALTAAVVLRDAKRAGSDHRTSPGSPRPQSRAWNCAKVAECCMCGPLTRTGITLTHSTASIG